MATGRNEGCPKCQEESEAYLFKPQDSPAPSCDTAKVEIRVNPANFKSGGIKLVYDSDCADVTNWERNEKDFPFGTWDSDTPGEEWITFTAKEKFLTGDYLIGTLTIHCVCEGECTTALDFVKEDATGSALFDKWGNEVPVTWTGRAFRCITELEAGFSAGKTEVKVCEDIA